MARYYDSEFKFTYEFLLKPTLEIEAWLPLYIMACGH